MRPPHPRIMLAASGPKSVRETEELRLVNLVQDLDNGTLDNLVLQPCNAERALPAIRLRNHPSPGWLRPISSPMHAAVQIGKVRLQISAVRIPCHAVDSRSRITLEPVIRFGEQFDIDMMEQRGKSLIPMFPRCLS